MFLAMCCLCFCVTYPDGTLVLSSKPGTVVGNIASRLTGGDQYTHIAIVIDNQVYESDWPRSKSTPLSHYGKRRGVYHYYRPTTPYTREQVDRMRDSVQSRLGQPYRLRNFLRPGSRQTEGTWCSPFVATALNASGRYQLAPQQSHKPQTLLESVHHDYRRVR
jgi:hypothetical protein